MSRRFVVLSTVWTHNRMSIFLNCFGHGVHFLKIQDLESIQGHSATAVAIADSVPPAIYVLCP